MEELKLFQVYRKRKDGGYYHVTSVRALSLKDAIKRNSESSFGDFRVIGITIDTGQPYDSNDFPFRVLRKIKGLNKLPPNPHNINH